MVNGAAFEMVPMLDTLYLSFEHFGAQLGSERHFTAYASRNLRAAIAAIRAQDQVPLAETDDSMRRHALQSTGLDCNRATHLVAQ